MIAHSLHEWLLRPKPNQVIRAETHIHRDLDAVVALARRPMDSINRIMRELLGLYMIGREAGTRVEEHARHWRCVGK